MWRRGGGRQTERSEAFVCVRRCVAQANANPNMATLSTAGRYHIRFLRLARVADPLAAPRAERAGLPPIDGRDVWPLISGHNLTSPRAEVGLPY